MISGNLNHKNHIAIRPFMAQLNLPYWQTAQQVQDILLDLPENQRNRALYELLWLFDFDSLDAETDSQLAVLRLLWHDPRFQHLENIKHWLEEVLNSHDNAWFELQPEIEMLLDVLHPETCRTYGDHGGMTQDAEILEPFCCQNADTKYRTISRYGVGLFILEQTAVSVTP